MPSAAVCRAMKSTDTSRAASPSTRSRWTKARLPALRTRAAASATVRISPLSRKMTDTSLSRAAARPSSLLTAAITGPEARRSRSWFRSIGLHPPFMGTKKGAKQPGRAALRVSNSAQISGVSIIAGVEGKSKTEKPAFDILERETKSGDRIWRFSPKIKKQIDKKLWGWYAESTAMLKSGYLLMSLEKGVTVKETGTSIFVGEGAGRSLWVQS